MKVLMINSVCGIRSTGRICTDLATALEAQGHEVKIAYGREEVPEEFQKYAVRIGTDLDVKMHGALARILDGAGFGSKNATRRFLEWAEEFDPDVIHLHNLHGYYINIELLFDYLKTCGKKIIWTLHDCWAFTGHSAYCDAVRCEKWKTGCNHCPQQGLYPKSFCDNSKANWIRKKRIMQGIPHMKIVTPSEWLADQTRESFLSEYKIAVINNGIDTFKFHPTSSFFREKYQLCNKYILLGVSTSWDDMKGLSDFIKLSRLLSSEYKIVLVGVNARQKNKLPKDILVIEKTNNVEELAGIYTAADLLLNLSYCENYPTVNLEAMACGTPVLTYRTGGSPETVNQIRDLIVEKGDLDSLVRKIYLCTAQQFKYDIPNIKDMDLSATVEKYIKEYMN